MRLLVTGGAGFIGSNLLRYLMPKEEITEIINIDALTYAGDSGLMRADSFGNSKYKPRYMSLQNRRRVLDCVLDARPTHVIHLAAESHVDRSIANTEDFVQSNVVGTVNLMDACRAAWTDISLENCRFLHVSTDEVFGSLDAEAGIPKDYRASETAPYNPQSPYAASKASADMMVWSYFHTHGFPATITHGCNNFGPRQFPEKLIPVVILAALDRRPIPIYGDGRYTREWIHVDDHCAGLYQVLIAGGSYGESYCLGSGNDRDNLTLVHEICKIVDELCSRPEGETSSLITHVKNRPGHDRRYAMYSYKAESQLGWRASSNFSNRLRETVIWYMDNRKWVDDMNNRASSAAL